jgi:CRP-like cAMP-binding protein
MSNRERLALLHRVRDLAGYDDAHLLGLAHFMDEACVPAGTMLAQEGQLCHELLIVASGTLEVCRRGRAASLGPGGVYGWEAMRNRGRHEATLRTLSAAHLLVMSHEQFRALDGLS